VYVDEVARRPDGRGGGEGVAREPPEGALGGLEKALGIGRAGHENGRVRQGKRSAAQRVSRLGVSARRTGLVAVETSVGWPG